AYRVRLDEFEGPLDLLLHLIKKNEINIYDIPISVITKQYLDYISLLKYLNLEVAGEFLVMAATLIHIKSRMLLPVETDGDEDEDGEDPRAELVRRLLEYKQFKEAAAELVERGQHWREVYGRPAFCETASARLPEEIDDAPLDMTLFDLVDAFQDIAQRTPVKAFVEVTPDHLTVKDRMNYILERLEYEAAIPFESLFVPEEGRLVLIVTFLGLLELVRIRLVRAYQSEAFGAILLSRAFLPATAGDAESEETEL
ncbi:MAG: segregation/condensation protein A, partial [Nitrospirota bacterium]